MREPLKTYTKKDFVIEWFSGSGPGGQHRNKHQNCCRIIHPETGLRTQATRSRSREANKREAFYRLAGMLLATESDDERRKENDVVRTYKDGEWIDHSTGIRNRGNEPDLDRMLSTLDRENERPKTGR